MALRARPLSNLFPILSSPPTRRVRALEKRGGRKGRGRAEWEGGQAAVQTGRTHPAPGDVDSLPRFWRLDDASSLKNTLSLGLGCCKSDPLGVSTSQLVGSYWQTPVLLVVGARWWTLLYLKTHT